MQLNKQVQANEPRTTSRFYNVIFLVLTFFLSFQRGRGSRRETKMVQRKKEETARRRGGGAWRRSDPAFTGPVEVRIQGQAPTRLPDF